MACDNFLFFPEKAMGGLLEGKSSKPEGESTDKWFGNKTKYKALECLSIAFGVAQAETTGSQSTGSAAGKAKFEEFTIEKFVDMASVPLYSACAAGAHFPTVQLAIRKAGGENLIYAQFIFRQVFVTAINWTGGQGEEAPKETIKFKYGAFGIQYVRQLATGLAGIPIQALWSNITNRPELTVTGLAGPPGTWPIGVSQSK
jgi:type VI secretion system secreted protein Hcp